MAIPRKGKKIEEIKVENRLYVFAENLKRVTRAQMDP